MSDKVTKEDWKTAEKQFEGLLVNSKLSAEVQEVVLSHIRKRLLEYPDEKEDADMKTELKNLLTGE